MGDELALLFKLKGENSQLKSTVAETRTAIAQLRSSFGSDFAAMEGAGKNALSGLTDHLNIFVGQKIPLVGGAFIRVTENLKGLSEQTQETGGIMSSFAGAGGPIAIATAATVALGAAILGLLTLTKSMAEGFFELSKASAEWQGKLFDLSQQTGLSVETLSALDVLATQTGSSLDQITASLGIFQKHLESAQDPTSKEAKLLHELGIETNNTEEALRQSLAALARMPEGFHQTATALELFGRGGKALLAILKESHGDLDGAIEKLHDLNLIVSGESAEAADKFNDQLDTIHRQLRAVTAEITKESIPAILEVLKDFTQAIKENHEAITFLGSAVKGFFTPTMWGIEGVLRAINTQLAIGRGLWERFFAAAQLASGNIPTVDPNGIPAVGEPGKDPFAGFGKGLEGIGTGFHGRRTGGGGGGRSARVTRDTGERDAERQEKAELKFYEDLVVRVAKTIDQLNLIDVSTHQYAVNQSILNGVLKDASPAMQQMALDEAHILDNKEKQLKLQNALRSYFEEQAKQIKEAEEGTQSYLSKAQDFIKSLEDQGAVLSSVQKFWLQFNATLLDVKNTIESMPKIDLPEPIWATSKDKSKGSLGPLGDAPLPPIFKDKNLNPFDVFRQAIEDMDESMKKTLAGGALDAMSEAFRGVGEAVGQAVQAFVLYGSAGASVQQVTAQILASIAQQAAVQAIYELAQGLAVLALAFFGVPNAGPSASAHFAAAAMFGAIAGVAAVAGRAVAGDSFKQGGAATGGGGSGSGGGGRSSSTSGTSNGPTVINAERNKITVEVLVRGEPGRTFHADVASAVLKNINGNGAVRAAIKREK